MLSLEINLTQKGLDNFEKVIEAVFNYARKIQKLGHKKYIFKEMQKMGQLNFEFHDDQSGMMYCQGLASRMQIFDDQNMSDILRSQYIADTFDMD